VEEKRKDNEKERERKKKETKERRKEEKKKMITLCMKVLQRNRTNILYAIHHL
jgi:hypothetical protein